MLAVTDNLTVTLLLVLSLLAVFAWAVRRGLTAARETVLIGSALGFFAVSVVFNSVLHRNMGIYGGRARDLLGTSALMTLPLLLAIAYGVWALARSTTPRTLATVTIGTLTLRLVRGTLASFVQATPTDAVIYPARTDGRMASPDGAALRAFAGRAVEKGAMSRAPLHAGRAAITPAGGLKCTYLVHASVYAPARRAEDADVKRALHAALALAKKHHCRRVALAAFATPPAGVHPDMAAHLITDEVLALRDAFDTVTVVVSDRRAVGTFVSRVASLGPS